MYYRVAIQVEPSPLWQWKSTVLSSLNTLFQFLRLYRALPQDHLRVFSSSSQEGLKEQFVQENKGLGSNSVTAAQFLQKRMLCSLEVVPVKTFHMFCQQLAWKADGLSASYWNQQQSL